MAGPTSYAYATAQTQLGIAIETSRGTPVAPAFWVKSKDPKYTPDRTLIPDDTLQGSMVDVYSLVPGLRMDKHGWSSYPYLDSFPVYLRCLLGSADTVTAAPTATALQSAVIAGASTIPAKASIAAGSWIVIDTGGIIETHLTTAVSGTAAPFTVTLDYPLIYGHAANATITGLTGHQFSLLNNAGQGNQPPSATITDWDGDQWRQLAAAQLDKLTIKGNATGLVDYTVDWFANPSITPTTPTPTFTGIQAVPGWTFAVSIAGTQLNYVMDWEIELGRGVKPIPALQGTQEYFLYFANALTATAKVTVVEQSGAPQLTEFLNGTVNAIDITCFDLTNGFAMNLHSTTSMWKTGNLIRGKEEVTAELECQMLPSTADALAGGVSPIIATVANAQATPY